MPGVKSPYYIENIMDRPTKEGINEIIKAIKESVVLEGDERGNKYSRGALYGHNDRVHGGIRINPDDGSITIQDISYRKDVMSQSVSSTFEMTLTEFSTDGNGGVIEKETVSLADSEIARQSSQRLIDSERVINILESHYDSNGIEVDEHLTQYGYRWASQFSASLSGNPFQQIVTYEAHAERDENNPFICRVDTRQNEFYDENNEYIPSERRKLDGITYYYRNGRIPCDSRGIHYFPASAFKNIRLWERVSTEPTIRVQNFGGSHDTITTPVFYDTFDEAQQYYEEHTKEEIEKRIKLTQTSDRFYKGKKFLAESAGLDLEELEK